MTDKLTNGEINERVEGLKKEIFDLEKQLEEGEEFMAPFIKDSLNYAHEMLEMYERFLKSKNVGRKPMGVTKKVSITLDAELWEVIKKENKNISAYFRGLVRKDFE